MKYIYSLFFIIFFSTSLLSQWSSDPNVNLKVSDLSGEQVLPKIARTSDGGCYIVWFDQRAGGYRVYLQKFNSAGIPQFAADGLLISSNPQSSSLVNYDMIADDSNNAVIVFTDTRSGTVNPFAYKVSPSGTFLWGPNGVTLTDSAGTFQPNPKVAQTSDGSYVITWIWSTNPQKVAMQRLNNAGVKQWGTGPIKLAGGPGETFTYPSLVRSDAGSIILMWSKYTGTFINPGNYRLLTQKFNTSGSPLWNGGNPDTVYGLGNVTGFFVPSIYPDGNNGAFYLWQDDRNSTNTQTSYVQRFNSAGVPQFPVNGSASSTEAATNKFSAALAYAPSTGETFMFWKHTNSLQSMQGVYGQKFNSAGVRQWTDNGKVFLPLGSNEVITMTAAALDTNIHLYYNLGIGAGNNNIKAFKTGPSGILQWGGAILTPAGSSSSKGGLVGTLNSTRMSIIAWSDGRIDGGIYAQNINPNGTFGGPTGITNNGSNPDAFRLDQNYPNPFNPETNISFTLPEISDISLTIYNSLGQKVYTFQQKNITAGSHFLNWNASGFPSGVYFYKLEAGNYSSIKRMILVK